MIMLIYLNFILLQDVTLKRISTGKVCNVTKNINKTLKNDSSFNRILH